MSTFIYFIHWIVYIVSYSCILFLFTKHYRIAASWLGLLFTTQIIFHGCILTKLENYFRGLEGKPLKIDEMLTATITSSNNWQYILSFLVVALCLVLALNRKK